MVPIEGSDGLEGTTEIVGSVCDAQSEMTIVRMVPFIQVGGSG